MIEQKGTPAHRKQVTKTALFIAISLGFAMYALVGFCGAAMFGDHLQDNILKSFAPCHWWWSDALGLCYAFVVIVAYPL